MTEKKKVAAVALTFIALACVYFIPSAHLGGILPGCVVKYRIIGPLLTLTVAGIFFLPPLMTLAMGFSMAGDFAGAYGSFIFQMGFFAVAHILLIAYFGRRLKSMSLTPGKRYVATVAAVCVALLAFALTFIIPCAPAGGIRIGCAVYAALICTMTGFASMQGSRMLAVGAVLFLLSDMVLSWNKFVSPVAASRWLIMVPYYGGQLLLWLGTVRAERHQESL